MYIMSGQPVNTPLDIKKYRQQYLANLQQEIANDTKNYEANLLFKKTGVPQQLADTRSMNEKLMDLFRLKQDLRGSLKEITDNTNAEQVVEQLTNDELRFASSSIPYIIAELKPKFKYGVPSEVLLGYIRAYIRKQQRNFGVENGVQAEVGDRILLNQRIIMDNVIDKQDLNQILSDLKDVKASKNIINALVRSIVDLQNVLPDIQTVLQKLDKIENANVKEQINELLTQSLRELPTKDQVDNLLLRLEEMNQAKDRQGVESIILKLNEVFQIKGDISEEIEIIKQLIDEKTSQLSIQIEKGTGRYIPLDELGQLSRQDMVNYIYQIKQTGLAGDELVKQINRDLAEQAKAQGTAVKNYQNAPTEYLYQSLVTLDEDVRAIFANRPVSFIPSAKAETPQNILEAKAITPQKKQSTSAGQKKMVEAGLKKYEVVEELPEKPAGKTTTGVGFRKTISGKGIGRPRTRNYEGSTRPHRADVLTDEDIDFTSGIKVEPRFIPIGKYVLNKRMLRDNIISLKTKNGGYLRDFKTERVSDKLGGVIRTIVGNGMPSFEDLAGLTETEKEYLHKLSKKTDIIDKLNIPAPSKKQDEKDINEFEILKGQILAGNDSVQLLQNFKKKLIYMGEKGLLPKSQVKDMLYEIANIEK